MVSIISSTATTKKGNEYKKNNVFKVGDTAVGMGLGAYTVSRPGIDYLIKKTVVKAGSKIKDAGHAADVRAFIVKNLKGFQIGIKTGAVAALAVAGLALGAVADAVINKVKAKEADKAAEKAAEKA